MPRARLAPRQPNRPIRPVVLHTWWQPGVHLPGTEALLPTNGQAVSKRLPTGELAPFAHPLMVFAVADLLQEFRL